MSVIASIITLLYIILSPAAPPAHAKDPTTVPRFEATDCPFEIPQGETIHCGYLVVPENRAQPDGSIIRVFVAIVRSHSPTPKPDPIIYINGGPGGKAKTIIRLMWNST